MDSIPIEQDPQIILLNHLKTLSKERASILDYLKNICCGRGMWFGVVRVSRAELEKVFRKNGLKSNQLFHLGVSLGTLIRISSGQDFAKALDTLIAEFEAYLQESAMTSTKYALSRVLLGGSKKEDMASDWLLEISNPSFALDFTQTFLMVIEVLLIAYEKLVPPTRFCSDQYFELATRVDTKIWKLLIVPVLKDLETVGSEALMKEFELLDVRRQEQRLSLVKDKDHVKAPPLIK